jgi:peptidyl-prolyl cis-trans isomerase C
MSAHKLLLSGLAGAVLLVGGRAAAQTPQQQTPPQQMPPAGQANVAAGPAAIVNGEVIPMAEVEALVKGLGPSPTPLAEATRRDLMRDALASLIDSLLLDQFLRNNRVDLPPGAVERKMGELAAKLQQEQKTIADFCKATNQTEADLRKGVDRMLRWEAYVTVHSPDGELQRYYTENKDFFDGVRVKASHIFLAVPPTVARTEVEKMAGQLMALKGDIVAGKITFEDAAKKYSQCPVSGPNGGNVGYITRKMMVDESFARTAFALPNGQISDVVRTNLGLHLIKVTERQPGKPSDFNAIKEDVRILYGVEMHEGILMQLRQAANIDVRMQ